METDTEFRNQTLLRTDVAHTYVTVKWSFFVALLETGGGIQTRQAMYV